MMNKADWNMESEESKTDSEPSIADMIRDTANEVLRSRVPEGFQWIEAYGQYYSASCGFFYDPNTGLFYHSESETFYVFNEDIQQYEIYKCMKKTKWASRENKKKAKQLFPDFVDGFDQDTVDVCEIVFDIASKLCLENDGSDTVCSREKLSSYKPSEPEKYLQIDGDRSQVEYFDDITGQMTYRSLKVLEGKSSQESKNMKNKAACHHNTCESVISDSCCAVSRASIASDQSSEEEDERIQMREDEGFSYPPLLRIIDSKNRLHIITISGGCVGRQSDCDIVIEDLSVSRKIAEFIFVPEINSFVVNRLTNKGMVTLNDYELMVNDEREIVHGDLLRFGLECLRIHIHFGSNTCTGCEPGLLLTDIPTISQPMTFCCGETARRRNLKAIKAMYGINEYVENTRTQFFGEDRAAKRRRLFGSEMNYIDKRAVDPNDIHAGCLAKPVPGFVVTSRTDTEKPLDEANKGFRMLQNMGWKEGRGLGKEEQGCHEPVCYNITPLMTTILILS
ncbi:g-patch domain protein [Dictyocaulus viviparus]|uniref:G-patch domain protein n=1 Tax=Dictyocaulus viviparus TaxID=29172 RepID=A0A0D8XDF0_DICVI|nr:g-patch domain protein [Dictyocaulus viviparus]